MPKLYCAAARHPRRRSADALVARLREPLRLCVAESLEPRQLLSVATDANGWTVVTPPHSARVVYVSSSTGNDSHSGLSPSSAVRSLHAGMALIRNHSADQLLLQRGDTWHETLGNWTKSGISAEEPLVIGAYGTGARPTLATGTASAIVTLGEVDHLDLIGLRFYADARDPSGPDFHATDWCVGVQLLARTDGLLMEDCAVQDYGTNINIQDSHGPVKNITIRRSLVLDAYSASAVHSEGLFADGVQNLTLEENVFDHNGWNESVTGASATIFNHDAYLTNTTTGAVARGNIFSNASSHGLQARSGGDIEGNVFLADPLGLSFGLVRGADITPGGVSGIVNGNVFLGTRDIAGAARGIALEVANTKPGAPTVISNNVFSHDTQVGPTGSRAQVGQGMFPAIILDYGSDNGNASQAVGLNNLTVEGNIVYSWASGLNIQRGVNPGGQGPQALNGLSLRNNDFQNIRDSTIIQHDGAFDPAQEKWFGGRYSGDGSQSNWVTIQTHAIAFSKWADDAHPLAQAVRPKYAAPDRSAGTYSASLGGGSSLADFITTARSISSQNWDPRYTAAGLTAYVQGGFNETNAAPRDWRAPSPPSATVTWPAAVSTADASFTFSVTFTDEQGVDVNSIQNGSVYVTRPGGASSPATLLSVTGGDTDPVVATYSVAAPHVVWRQSDQGRWRAMIADGQVKDTQGFTVPAGVIGDTQLAVQQVPPPPQVRKLTFHAPRRGPQSLTIRFTSDVSASLDVTDIVVSSDEGQMLDTSQLAMSYEPATNTATFTFPGLPEGILPAGHWHIRLAAAGISGPTGLPLDGNKDGLGGDDFTFGKTIKSRGIIMPNAHRRHAAR